MNELFCPFYNLPLSACCPSSVTVQSEMDKMKKNQLVQAVYIRKMQALPGKVPAALLLHLYHGYDASSAL